eukprot:gene8161-1416_t
MAPDNTDFPFPVPLFEKFVKENNGYFPVSIEALDEGTCVHARIPVYQITASGEYAPLCTFLETLLTMICTQLPLATLILNISRDVIETGFEATTDLGRDHFLIPSRLHDFGFRGCTTVEQSIIGGCSHLISFVGSDTLSACYYAQCRCSALMAEQPLQWHGVATDAASQWHGVAPECKASSGGNGERPVPPLSRGMDVRPMQHSQWAWCSSLCRPLSGMV